MVHNGLRNSSGPAPLQPLEERGDEEQLEQEILGERIKNVHLKEFTKKGTDHSLESFRPLLDGTTNWPAVMEALDKVGYRGYLTFEYFHPYPHYPEALIYQTSDSLDRMLGRKG